MVLNVEKMAPIDYAGARHGILSELENGSVLFAAWNGSWLVSKGIRYIIGGEFNHVSYIKPEWLKSGKLAGRVLHEEALNHGTVINQFSYSLRKKSVNYVVIFHLKGDSIKAHEKAVEILNRPYGFKTIALHYLINRIPKLLGTHKFMWIVNKFGIAKKADGWIAGSGICSQVGTDIAEAAGAVFKNNEIPNWAVDPAMFAAWPILTPLWKIKGGGFGD